jgi:hypothetical protein
MLRSMTLGCTLLAATLASAQTLVHEWDLADRLGEWYTAHIVRRV